MINRDLIRRKIVQLTYAYYQNSDHNMENAEKELMFSSLQVIRFVQLHVAAHRCHHPGGTQALRRRGGSCCSVRVSRNLHHSFAFNTFAVQLEENKMLARMDRC